MPVLETIIGTFGTAAAMIAALASEDWTRYFLILGIGLTNNVVQAATGFDAVSSLIGAVVEGVTGIQGFGFPTYYGVNTFTIVCASYPLWIYLLKKM